MNKKNNYEDFSDTNEEIWEMLKDWKIFVGAIVGAAMLFGLFWASAVVCVAMGGSVDVCGL